jgi:2-dehydropantoate 2-reductase
MPARADTALKDGPIAILGAGSLGRLWAGYLPAGHAVFLCHPSRPVSGPIHYRLKRHDGTESVCQIPVLALTSARPSLLLVTTKAGDTVDALERALPTLPSELPIVLFQNGLGCQQAVAGRWPDRPILAASTTEGANRPEDDLLVHAGRGQTWIGALTDSGRHFVAAAVAQLQSSGLAIEGEPDIHQRLWDKLVVNSGINAFTTILDCPNGDILADPFFLEHIDDLSEEIAQVMAMETRRPLSAEQVRKRIYTVATSTAENTSSMRGDRQRGRSTEIDVINGYIVKRGEAAGIATPVNQMLVRRVKDLTE